MAAVQSFEEILERQCDKLRDLQTATIFIKSKDAIKEELFHMRAEVLQMSDGIIALRKMLNEAREQNDQCKELLLLMKVLHDKNMHIERNIPSQLISDYQIKANSLNIIHKEDFPRISELHTDRNQYESPIIDCKKALFNEAEVYPVVPLITQDEFSGIPKYIIGRQSIDTVNNLIDCINRILKKKYTLLSLGKAHARKQGELSLYLHYKKQELSVCSENECVYFFTKEDYEKETKSKLNKIKLNLITVLRHCRRLREHRIRNELQYVIITK
ncbi:spindle and kinetochore-associated protein 1-like [Hylaeus volcanicus]|uniref:spindle and kinetochore-associated protein 1-like n=1 Tax=Hylaeus volcanicus TaxID=313075 RepID=UPI0023B7E05F|nr:spindle and kinetochore-associated protein 1-like [Hylaeus volcanicus]